MRMDGAVGVMTGIVRRRERHVAVDAGGTLRRVVERSCALARHAAGLPRVVVVEAAEPPVVVHRHIEMHLVTRRAELGRILPHVRFHERPAMRLGIQVGQKPIERPDVPVAARGQFVERRVFNREVAVPHRAFHANDRMT